MTNLANAKYRALKFGVTRVALRDGRKAKLTDFTATTVAPDERTRCTPDANNRALYRDLQAKHDELSRTLRPWFG